jgi:hypothetical protein
VFNFDRLKWAGVLSLVKMGKDMLLLLPNWHAMGYGGGLNNCSL